MTSETHEAASPSPTSSASPKVEDSQKTPMVGSPGEKETRVEIKTPHEEDDPKEDAFRPLTKSDLMKYADDPHWKAARWVLFILFWILWLAMLVAAVALIVVAPKCPTPAPKQWWQKAPIYEVYVKSFKDSNNDGVGDLKGIQEKLDYFESLNIGSLWLTPIYPSSSSTKENAYDVKDYRNVDEKVGNLDDFKNLLASMKDRGLKLIMDFVPNHSSNEHEWFKKSELKEAPYTDFYIWRSAPNNWKSVFGGSAWTRSEKRNEYYLHQFYKEQPDLNLRNPLVVEELKNVLRFWLDLGVDGFRVDAVAHFFESENFEDEDLKAGATGDSYDDFNHNRTSNHPESIQLLKQFREVLDNKTEEDIYNPRIMLTEAYLPTSQLIKYYGEMKEMEVDDLSERSTVSQMPINFALVSDLKSPENFAAEKVLSSIKDYIDELPSWAWQNFQLGNHDNKRIASRAGPELIDAMNMIYMLLPGTPITYYGEEIGMNDGTASGSDVREAYRTPMQWSDGSNAGFSESTPWVAPGGSFKETNVANQSVIDPNNPLNSHLAIYSYLANLRQNEAILFGSLEFVNSTAESPELFGYARVKKGNPGTLVLVNFGGSDVTADLSEMKFIPERGTVLLRSVYNPDTRGDESKSIEFKSITVKPKEGLVIAFVPKFS